MPKFPPEEPHEDYAYLIWGDGSRYYAKNGNTKQIDFCETVASTVIQAAINALTSGGKIFIKAGVYPLGTITLVVQYGNVLIMGEGKGALGGGTINDVAPTQITYSGTTEAITVGQSGSKIGSVIFQDLEIKAVGGAATGATTIGIRFINALYSGLYRVDVSGFAGGDKTGACGVRFDALGAGMYGASDFVIDCKLYGNDQGIRIDGAGGSVVTNHVLIRGGCILGVAATDLYGVYVRNGENNVVEDVDIEGYDTAIRSDSKYNVFSIVRQESITTIGVIISAGALDNVIAFSLLSGATKISDAGTRTKFVKNLNYVTENSVNSTGTGAQQAVAHGCGFTPTKDEVFLSERDTGLAIPYLSADPDATNIYVTATLNKTWNALIRKK